MKKYVITTESGCDLPKEFIKRYNIKVIPMNVTIGDSTYPDGSFSVEKVFEYYDETGMLPKTSGSTPEDCAKVYREIRKEHPDAHIIHIAYSSVTTVSFNSAHIAAGEFENITLVDSKHLTIGANVVIKATADFIEDNPNQTPEGIIAFVENIRQRTHMVFIPKTLLYLKAGGRVSKIAFRGANLFKICPTITLEDGHLVSGKKYRGTFDRCLKSMIDDFFVNHDIALDTVLIGGSLGVSDGNKELIFSLLEEKGVPNINWLNAGAVISSHSGPGAIAIAGIEKI